MRKYKILLVFIVAVFSLFGFIIYRNEYYKLRNTFEIGRFFVSDKFGDDCAVLNDTVTNSTKYNNFFSRPPHQWLKIDDFYIYSAFWRTLNDKISRSVAIGVSSKQNDYSKYDCHVWYHSGGALFSVNGKLTSTSKIVEGIFVLNEFFCEVNNIDVKGTPHMFVFINKSNNNKYFVPIYFKPFDEKINNAAVCVFPDMTGLERSNLIEFLSYHKLIGFTDVIVYDSGMHHGILSILEDVFLKIDFLRSFSVLSWRFPYRNVHFEEEFTKLDCLYRVYNKVDLVTVLHWNDYLIPIQGKSILPIFNSIDMVSSVKYSLDTQKCCTELKSDKRAKQSWPLMLKKTSCLLESQKGSVILNPTAFSDQPFENVSISQAVIKTYDTCESQHFTKETKVTQDKAALKFIVDLMSNKLLQLSRSGMFVK